MAAEMSQVLAWGMDLPAYRGKVYHLCEPDQITKAKFEGWLKRTAMEECIAASQGLSEKDQEINRRLVLTDLALKKYAWGAEKWSLSLNTQTGIVKLISMLARDHKNRELTEDLVGEMLDQDNPIAPWLLGAVYIVCGMDPTMALAAGRLTVAEASKNKAENMELVARIMSGKPASSSPTSPSSGPPTPG